MVKTKNPELERERRQLIMWTVRRLLTDGSHKSLTLDRIAREAGVSKGMLTYYFATKDELVTASIEHFLALQGQALRMIVDDHDTPIPVRLRRLIEVALPDREQVELDLRFLVEVWSFAKARPAAMQIVRDAYQHFRQACVEMIDEGAERGYVVVADRRLANAMINALLDGLSFQIVLDDQLDPVALRENVFRLVDALLTEPGLLAPAS
jgi:AcrR family transcriptional regulator